LKAALSIWHVLSFLRAGRAASPHHVNQQLVLEGHEVEALVQLPLRAGFVGPGCQQLLDFAVLRMQGPDSAP
jgi:hypothetical protein